MYFFGIDIPLVELLVAMGIITIIILFEAIILLYFILHHKKDIQYIKQEVTKISRGHHR
ncbi:hypothetical protein KY343_05030 [Candidatus Woesearchaeota archaeon]|nr:hypothetical protein [Candidatus Woesearchaeota archaeon]